MSRNPTSDGPTHYVLVVHGTFNAPTPRVLKWYQLDEQNEENFCQELNDRLERTSLGRAVWRDLNQTWFFWSGENDHGHRLLAAKRLCKKFIEIAERDQTARIHVIAHSHGGNVLLKAIELYRKRLDAQSDAQSLPHFYDLIDAIRASARHVVSDQGAPVSAGAVLAELHATRGPAIPRFLTGDKILLQEMVQGRILEDQGVVGAYLRLFLKWERYFHKLRPLSRRMPVYTWGKGEKFRLAWIQENNRIGKVVFLGTPFFRKQWVDTGVLRNLRLALSPAIVLYAFILLSANAFGLLPWISFLSWDLREWPDLLLWVWGSYALLPAAMIFRKEFRYPTNLYFDEKRWPREEVERTTDDSNAPELQTPHRRIPALVMSAKFLDEALLALSSEPLIVSQIFPQLDNLLYPERRWGLYVKLASLLKWLHQKTEEDEASQMKASRAERDSRVAEETVGLHLGLDIFRPLLQLTAILGYCLIFIPWAILRRFLVKPLLERMLIETIAATAYGISAGQLKGARILVSSHLNLPKVFSEDFRDVSKSALETTARSQIPGEDRGKRYAHISNDDDLAKRRNESEEKAWKKVVDAMPVLWKRYKASFALDPTVELDKKAFEADLARTWFTVKERFREVTGAIELDHSLYYSNPRVINTIAKFLSKEATPSGTDVSVI